MGLIGAIKYSAFDMDYIRSKMGARWWDRLSSGDLVKFKTSIKLTFENGDQEVFKKGDLVRVKRKVKRKSGVGPIWSVGRKDRPYDESQFSLSAIVYLEPLDEKDLWGALKPGDHVIIKKDLTSQSTIDAFGVKNIDRGTNSGMRDMEGWEVVLIGRENRWWYVRSINPSFEITYDWSPEWFERVHGKAYNGIWKKDLDDIGVKYRAHERYYRADNRKDMTLMTTSDLYLDGNEERPEECASEVAFASSPGAGIYGVISTMKEESITSPRNFTDSVPVMTVYIYETSEKPDYIPNEDYLFDDEGDPADFGLMGEVRYCHPVSVKQIGSL